MHQSFWYVLHLLAVLLAAFKMLDEIAYDHEITLREFESWLVLATKLGNHQSPTFVLDYEGSPHVGHRAEQVTVPSSKDAAAPAAQYGTTYHSWNEMTMSQSVRRMQYAVRGKLVQKAEELQANGRDILFTNVGNPHGVGQTPISYYRQAMALCDLPACDGVENPLMKDIFPSDVIERAKRMRSSIGSCGTGAYTGSQGILDFRMDVAKYIEERDGHPAYPGNIFLTNGASSAIEFVMTALISSILDAIMIPIPQYPIYSALIEKLGGRQVGYYLDESQNWAAPREELERRLHEALSDGLNVKAMALINPGNPTGQVYTREDLEVICTFCAQHDIVLLADEVYQRNVYAPNKEFLAAKKIALETPGCENLQVVSFHSTSKGLIGECGRRGGYMELHNIDPFVQAQLYKLASAGLCSNVPGQLMTSLMVRPPLPGEGSYDQFVKEESNIYNGLKRRSKALVDGLNQVDGIACNPAEGAMYAFPRIELPRAAITAAEKDNMAPDALYCLSLLEETGICVVPASGFGQADGRYGFRTTFLPSDEQMEKAIDDIAKHHKKFCDKYSVKSTERVTLLNEIF